MGAVTARDALLMLQRHGARLVTGAAGLSRPITWACTAHARPPAFEELRGGELTLLSLGTLGALHALDDTITLSRLLQDLDRRGVSAIAVAGLLPDSPSAPDAAAPAPETGAASLGERRSATAEEMRLADGLDLPLMSLPAGTPLADIEREIIAAVVAPNAPAPPPSGPRGIYDALVHDSLRGDDERALAQHLATLARAAVVLSDAHNIHWLALPPEFPLARDALLNLLRRPSSRAQVRALLEASSPAHSQAGDALGVEVLSLASGFVWVAAPLHTPERTIMALALVTPSAGVDAEADAEPPTTNGQPSPAAILGQVAPLFALTLARRHDFAGAEHRLRAETLDALLSGAYPDEERMRARAAQLGHDLSRPHVALVVTIAASSEGPALSLARGSAVVAALDALTAGMEGTWARGGDGEIAALVPVPADGAASALAALAARAGDLLAAALASTHTGWSAGMSEPATEPAGARRAAGEARDTARLGLLVLGPAHVARAADLGIYRLLLRLRETGELEAFCRQTLGPLLADARHADALLATLDAFFASNGNLAEAARRLDLHRNSLIYRLGRIRALLGHDLEDPEARLALQLALKARRVLAL